MPEPQFPPGLLDYFAIREVQRRREINECWPRLESDIAAFMNAHPDDPGLPKLVARLIREAAVAAYVCGMRQAGGSNAYTPPDVEILHRALGTCRSMSDLYPGFALFDGKTDEDEEPTDD